MKKLRNSEPQSRQNGPLDSSAQLPPGPPSPPLEVATDGNSDGITRFVALVTAGIKSWLDAGKLLNEMQRKDKNVFNKVIGHCEWLTVDSLMTFTRIGRMELRPEVLLLNSRVQSKLLKLGYSQQSKLLDARVPVVIDIKPDGEPLMQQKKVTELTGTDLDLLIDGSKLRTTNEQLNALRNRRKSSNHVATVAPLLTSKGDEKKLMFLGMYRIVMRFGKPELVKCVDIALGAQRVLLAKDMGGDMSGVIELTKWSENEIKTHPIDR